MEIPQNAPKLKTHQWPEEVHRCKPLRADLEIAGLLLFLSEVLELKRTVSSIPIGTHRYHEHQGLAYIDQTVTDLPIETAVSAMNHRHY